MAGRSSSVLEQEESAAKDSQIAAGIRITQECDKIAAGKGRPMASNEHSSGTTSDVLGNDEAETSRKPSVAQGKTSMKTVTKRRSPYRAKKPKDMPRRPLSAYNIFFKEERARMLEEMDEDKSDRGGGNGGGVRGADNMGFEAMAKTIGSRWKLLNKDQVQKYKELAKEDMERYRSEMDAYHVELARRSRREREEAARQRERDTLSQLLSLDAPSQALLDPALQQQVLSAQQQQGAAGMFALSNPAASKQQQDGGNYGSSDIHLLADSAGFTYNLLKQIQLNQQQLQNSSIAQHIQPQTHQTLSHVSGVGANLIGSSIMQDFSDHRTSPLTSSLGTHPSLSQQMFTAPTVQVGSGGIDLNHLLSQSATNHLNSASASASNLISQTPLLQQLEQQHQQLEHHKQDMLQQNMLWGLIKQRGGIGGQQSVTQPSPQLASLSSSQAMSGGINSQSALQQLLSLQSLPGSRMNNLILTGAPSLNNAGAQLQEQFLQGADIESYRRLFDARDFDRSNTGGNDFNY